MKNHESVIIINEKLKQKEIKDEIEKVKKLINSFGKVMKVEDLGVKKLAYEIKKHSKGYYCVFTFNADESNITELERYYRINDNILKFITVRTEE